MLASGDSNEQVHTKDLAPADSAKVTSTVSPLLSDQGCQKPVCAKSSSITKDREDKITTAESLSELYLYGSAAPTTGCPETNSDSSRASPSSTMVMTECVQRTASVIYAEFETLIEAYGLPVVERLMPLVIGLLENLDELYKDRSAYQAEVDQLREQCSFTISELDREKERRKQSELRLLQTEDTFDEERKSFESKIESLSSTCRQTELRFQNAKDQITRLESKEAEWKKESTRLHDRINELIRSNVELTDQVKYAARQRPPSGRVSVIRLGSTVLQSVPNISDECAVPENKPSLPTLESMFDDTSTDGFGFDEMSCTEEAPLDDELPDDPSPTPTSESDLRGFAGMRREIDILIKENMDLVETKNALNVVKDDLIAKIDTLTIENTSLKESVSLLTQVRANLQAELISTDQLLSDARSEIDSLRERVSDMSRKLEDDGVSSHRKRFTRAEMSRVLSERNQYKERLIELQEAVRLTDALRAGQKGHPELLEGINPERLKASWTATQSSGLNSTAATRPFQTLQNLFAAFTLGTRSDVDSTRSTDSASGSAIGSQAWVSLSQKRTKPPIYGWCTGISHSGLGVLESPSKSRTNLHSTSNCFPVPVQSQSIGDSRKHQLEIVAALAVPIWVDSSFKPFVWLLCRGPSETNQAISPNRTARSYVGLLLIFAPHRFRQSLCSHELDAGFLPTAGAFIQPSCAPNSSFDTSESVHSGQTDFLELQWDPTQLSSKPDAPTTYVIISSNDGRFLILCPRIVKVLDGASEVESIEVQIIGRFSLANTSMVANCLISVEHLLCLSLSNSDGNNRLICFNFPETLSRTVSRFTSSMHAFVTIPGVSEAAGPMSVCVDQHNDRKHVWLGSAGGGQLHCLDSKSLQFVSRRILPPETPCLHAIAIQPLAESNSALLWVSVSGFAFQKVVNNSTKCKSDSGRGMARLLAYSTDTAYTGCIRQIDLTALLCAMIDTEGVTDPIDLTICRLLFVPQSKIHSLWFATRSGFVGRFQPNDHPALSTTSPELEIPSSQTVSMSCHGFRRPVCTLIQPYEHVKPANYEDILIVAVGHDYVNLRPVAQKHRQASASRLFSSPTADSTSTDASNRLDSTISGAHVIVWKLPSATTCSN